MLPVSKSARVADKPSRIDTPELDDQNAMVDDDTCCIGLMLQGFRKAEQHVAAIHLAAVERGCPASDPGSFARAI